MANVKETGIKALAVKQKKFFMIELKDIVVNSSWNERDLKTDRVQNHIRGLADYLLENGSEDMEPLSAYYENGKAILTDGFCRMAAAKLANAASRGKITVMPVRPEGRNSKPADQICSMLTRNNGLRFTFIEEARVIGRLLAEGLAKKTIAAKTSRSLTHIDNCELINNADDRISEWLAEDKVSLQLALEKIRKCNKIERPEYAVDHIEQEIGKAEAAGKVKATKRTAGKKSVKSGGASLEAPIHWPKVGRTAHDLIKRICDAYDRDDVPEVPDPIADVINDMKNYLEKSPVTN